MAYAFKKKFLNYLYCLKSYYSFINQTFWLSFISTILDISHLHATLQNIKNISEHHQHPLNKTDERCFRLYFQLLILTLKMYNIIISQFLILNIIFTLWNAWRLSLLLMFESRPRLHRMIAVKAASLSNINNWWSWSNDPLPLVTLHSGPLS